MNLADVRTPAEVEDLCARILGPRARPLVLVSTDSDEVPEWNRSLLWFSLCISTDDRRNLCSV